MKPKLILRYFGVFAIGVIAMFIWIALWNGFIPSRPSYTIFPYNFWLQLLIGGILFLILFVVIKKPFKSNKE